MDDELRRRQRAQESDPEAAEPEQRTGAQLSRWGVAPPARPLRRFGQEDELLIEERPSPREGVILATAVGTVDARSIATFIEAHDAWIRDEDCQVALDISSLWYCSSTGLGIFVRIGDALQHRGGGLALVGARGVFIHLVESLGLNAFFELAEDLEEALRHFEQRDNLQPTTTSQEPGAAEMQRPQP